MRSVPPAAPKYSTSLNPNHGHTLSTTFNGVNNEDLSCQTRFFQPALVVGRHVLLERGVPAARDASDVTGDPRALIEAFHRVGSVAQVEFFADQPVGHTVVVTVEFDVVVDVDGILFPFGELVGLGRKRLERRPIDLDEGRVPGAGQFLEGSLVERFKQLADALV